MTGIEGSLFKTKNPEKTREWDQNNLGLVTNEYRSAFEFKITDEPEKQTMQSGVRSKLTPAISCPRKKEFMVNIRMENMEAPVSELKNDDVSICNEIEIFAFGKFVNIMDPERNKIERWEPVDEVFKGLYEGKTTK